MNKNILKLLLFGLFSKLFSAARSSHRDLVWLRFSLFYLRWVKTVRLLFLTSLGVGICLLFLFMGLIMIDIVIFVYGPWNADIKMTIGLVLVLVYFFLAYAAFYFVSSESKWMSIFHADKMLKTAQEAEADKQPSG